MVVSLSVFSFATARKRVLLFAFSAAAFAVAVSPAARALEHVTLRSGFTVDCAHHEVYGDHVRLYTGQGADYQEVSMLQIANIEFFPDPPKPVALSKPAGLTLTQAPQASSAEPENLEREIRDLLVHAGAEHNIDVELLASVIHTESGYHTRAISRAGARGLMQLMPATARTYGAQDAFKPDQNIAAGAAFLDEMLKRYNDNLALALAAYNAGPGAVERYHGVPPFRETRAYVTRVINEFYRRKTALAAAAKLAPAQTVAAAAFSLASSPAALSLR